VQLLDRGRNLIECELSELFPLIAEGLKETGLLKLDVRSIL
jgi:hypothetical protein